MPPQKPSPHRFIAPPATPRPKPKSNLRHAIAHSAHTPVAGSNASTSLNSSALVNTITGPELQSKTPTPARRFVVTPHRHAAAGSSTSANTDTHTNRQSEATAIPNVNLAPRTNRDRVEDPQSSPAAETTPPRRKKRALERVESIEEASQGSVSRLHIHDEEGEEDGVGLGVAETVEGRMFLADDDEEEGRRVTTRHHGEAEGEDQDKAQDEEDDGETEEMLFPSLPRPKRQRTSSPPSPDPVPASHAAPASHAPHRFRFPPPAKPTDSPFSAKPSHSLNTSQSDTPSTTVSTTPHRPTFLLPPQPTSPTLPSKPLPDLFSPSRKGGKYMQNGLASTVQSWIIEAATTSVHTSSRGSGTGSGSGVGVGGGGIRGRDSGRDKEREEGIKMKLRILALGDGKAKIDEAERCRRGEKVEKEKEEEREFESFPGMVLFALANTEPGMYNVSRTPDGGGEDDCVRLVLAGQGGARGAGAVKVRVGSVVGVRAPVWDVEIEDVGWTIGVDWVVL